MLFHVSTVLKMKRYKKLTFVVLFFVAIIALVVYRTRYLELRYAFEMGGLLGPPELPSNCLILNDTVSNKYEEYNFFSRPRNNWLFVNDFHFYSGFVEEKDDSVTVRVLGFGKNIGNCENFKCHIWFTLGGHKSSTDGVFMCDSPDKTSSGYSFLKFSCVSSSSGISGVPYMVVLLMKNNEKSFIPVHRKPKMLNSANRSALCVLPDYSGMDQLDIIEFLSYYQLIGFTDVIVYDNSIHYGIFNALEQLLSNIDYFKSFSVLPWNFPISNFSFMEEIIKEDCLYRTKGHVQLVTVVRWNDFLVPVQSNSIYPLLQKFDHGKTNLLKVDVHKCCTNLKDSHSAKKSWPQIFRKASCYSTSETAVLGSIVQEITDSFSLTSLTGSEFFINQYEICDNLHSLASDDNATQKFANDLVENTLLKIWRSGILFET